MPPSLTSAGPWLLAGCVVLSFMTSAVKAAGAGQPIYRDALEPGLLRGRIAATYVVLGVPLVAAAGALAVRGASVPVVIAILVLLLAAQRVEMAQWPDGVIVDLGRYMPTAAALTAWLVVTLLVGEGASPEVRDAAAWEAACGVVGAAYFLAGVTKVHEAGWRWVRWSNVGLLLIERSTTGSRWQRRLRRWLSGRRGLVVAGATFALAAELAAPCFWIPECRLAFVVAATGLQASIWFVLGYAQPEWILVVPAVALMAA